MIGDRDCAETSLAIKIHELGDAELPVAESGVHVEVGQKHTCSVGGSRQELMGILCRLEQALFRLKLGNGLDLMRCV